MAFMERVAPIVDETIRVLAKVKFVEDPIAGVRYSRATSIVSSAYKRHGRILEFALRESLRESNRHKVWNDEAFRVSREADALANTQDLDACRQTTLPYGNFVRTLQVDMLAFDSADESIRAYEIKRGNGQFDEVHPSFAQELWRVLQIRASRRGIQDHLLLRRSVDPAPMVPSQERAG